MIDSQETSSEEFSSESGPESADSESGSPEIDADPAQPGTVELIACDAAQRVGMEETVSSQTEALVQGDYATAYAYASPSFQSSVDLDSFTSLIEASYGPLTQTTEIRFGECLVGGDRGFGTLDARFDDGGQTVFGLRYVLEETANGWRVGGATSLTIVGGQT